MVILSSFQSSVLVGVDVGPSLLVLLLLTLGFYPRCNLLPVLAHHDRRQSAAKWSSEGEASSLAVPHSFCFSTHARGAVEVDKVLWSDLDICLCGSSVSTRSHW
jgi:hypothetical protein